MLVKFFKNRGGGGNAVFDYMLGKDRKREGASVLRGDAEETREIINGLNFAKNYTAGVLSFEEKHDSITAEQKQEIMTRFEEALLPDMQTRASITWIEHTDKHDRLELNFVVANVDLKTNKRLQPYYDKVDRKRINNCKDLINFDFDLSDPNDIARKRTIATAKDLPRDKQAVVKTIDESITNLVLSEKIKDRTDVIEHLQSAGFEIARTTKQSISIKDPNSSKNIRLKGAYYEQNFRVSDIIQTDYSNARERHRESIKANIEQVREQYQRQLENKSESNRKLYERDSRERVSKTTTNRSETPKKHEKMEFFGFSSAGGGRHGNNVYHLLYGEQKIRRNAGMESISREISEDKQADDNSQMHDQRQQQAILHRDRPESQKSILGEEREFSDSSNNSGVTDNDRNREIANQRIRKVSERASERVANTTRSYIDTAEKNRRNDTLNTHVIERIRETTERILQTVREHLKILEERKRLAEEQQQRKSKNRGGGMSM